MAFHIWKKDCYSIKNTHRPRAVKRKFEPGVKVTRKNLVRGENNMGLRWKLCRSLCYPFFSLKFLLRSSGKRPDVERIPHFHPFSSGLRFPGSMQFLEFLSSPIYCYVYCFPICFLHENLGSEFICQSRAMGHNMLWVLGCSGSLYTIIYIPPLRPKCGVLANPCCHNVLFPFIIRFE